VFVAWSRFEGPWHIYADLNETVYVFDAAIIDLCLSVYSWAPFRSTKAAKPPSSIR
jgi:hypothetical protein